MRDYIISQLCGRFNDADVKGFEAFCTEAGLIVANLVRTETEADVACDILLERLSTGEEKTTYSHEYPGQYDHHGYPTAYDELTIKFLCDDVARNLLLNIELFRKLIKERLSK